MHQACRVATSFVFLLASFAASTLASAEPTKKGLNDLLPEETGLITKHLSFYDRLALKRATQRMRMHVAAPRFPNLVIEEDADSVLGIGFFDYRTYRQWRVVQNLYPLKKQVRIRFAEAADCHRFLRDEEAKRADLKLFLDRACLDSQSLELLKSWPLKSLKIWGENLPDGMSKGGFENHLNQLFASLPQLEAIHLHFWLWVEGPFNLNFTQNKALKELTLYSTVTIGAVVLSPEARVESFSLRGLSDEVILELLNGNLPWLKKISLQDLKEADARALSKMPKLRELKLGYLSLTREAFVSSLKEIRLLSQLNCADCGGESAEAFLELAKQNPNLTDFEGPLQMGAPDGTYGVKTLLAALPQLQKLSVYGNEGWHVAPIRSMPIRMAELICAAAPNTALTQLQLSRVRVLPGSEFAPCALSGLSHLALKGVAFESVSGLVEFLGSINPSLKHLNLGFIEVNKNEREQHAIQKPEEGSLFEFIAGRFAGLQSLSLDSIHDLIPDWVEFAQSHLRKGLAFGSLKNLRFDPSAFPLRALDVLFSSFKSQFPQIKGLDLSWSLDFEAARTLVGSLPEGLLSLTLSIRQSYNVNQYTLSNWSPILEEEFKRDQDAFLKELGKKRIPLRNLKMSYRFEMADGVL